MFHSILVAIDGSDHSDAAIHYACDLAEKYDATLHFLHVPEVESSAIAVGSGAVLIPPSDERISEAGEPIMTQAVTLAKVQNRAPETTTIAQGNPAKAILSEAAAKDADLIVAGRRGLGALTGMLFGSVSQKITAEAKCPVLTVQ